MSFAGYILVNIWEIVRYLRSWETSSYLNQHPTRLKFGITFKLAHCFFPYWIWLERIACWKFSVVYQNEIFYAWCIMSVTCCLDNLVSNISCGTSYSYKNCKSRQFYILFVIKAIKILKISNIAGTFFAANINKKIMFTNCYLTWQNQKFYQIRYGNNMEMTCCLDICTRDVLPGSWFIDKCL